MVPLQGGRRVQCVVPLQGGRRAQCVVGKMYEHDRCGRLPAVARDGRQPAVSLRLGGWLGAPMVGRDGGQAGGRGGRWADRRVDLALACTAPPPIFIPPLFFFSGASADFVFNMEVLYKLNVGGQPLQIREYSFLENQRVPADVKVCVGGCYGSVMCVCECECVCVQGCTGPFFLRVSRSRVNSAPGGCACPGASQPGQPYISGLPGSLEKDLRVQIPIFFSRSARK